MRTHSQMHGHTRLASSACYFNNSGVYKWMKSFEEEEEWKNIHSYDKKKMNNTRARKKVNCLYIHTTIMKLNMYGSTK